MSAARPVVAVDGPSGSGKSSVSRGVARALGLRYLDTGAMYRALTWAVLRDGVDLADADAVGATARAAVLDFSTDPDESQISVDGTDVSRAIREEAVTSAVSAVAAVPAARAVLVERQRQAVRDADAAARGIVVEGRDIGSVVLPDADLKVWLVADPAVRAARRAAEDAAAGRLTHVHAAGEIAAVAEDLARRDQADASRAASPTTQADDAVVVDATHLGLAEVVAAVVALVEERCRA
ncbi:MAG TPA: (d)CMP kinase [Candidatus Nanopelagicales bacterium]|nr:(d)CMP kinase [Candidatus Nanopelagicales bacterium]